MDFQAIPRKIAEPQREEVRALEPLERKVWISVNGRKSIEHIAYMHNIVDDAKVEQVIRALQERGWIDF